MKLLPVVGVLASAAALVAPKCPAIKTDMVDKGFSAAAPWRVMSGGAAECSFTRSRWRRAGSNRCPCSARKASPISPGRMGETDQAPMFFYGHRGVPNVSAYLNLKGAMAAFVATARNAPNSSSVNGLP
jgi:hypothetical protein